MRKRPPSFIVFSLLGGLVLAGLSLYGFVLLRSRPGLPEGISGKDLIRIDNIEIQKPIDIQLVLTQKRVGDWAAFIVRRDGNVESRRAQIIAFYSKVPFPLIFLVIGLACYLIGFMVFLLKWEDPKARLLYWLAVVFAYPLIVSGGTYILGHGWFSFIPVVIFYFFYPLAPALLFHFSLLFSPRKRPWEYRIVYVLSLLFGAFFVAAVLTATLKSSLHVFRIYQSGFQTFRVYMIVVLLLAVYNFILAYRRAALEEHKAQIKWVFLGLLFGLGPFILIYQLPTVLGLKSVLTEESSSLSFLFIPVGFALSILRFRFLDVEVVINRSLVYSLLTVFTVAVYLFSVRVLQDLFSRVLIVRETYVSIGSALLAALAFNPARQKIQGFVDRSFFRQSYDYKKAVLQFSELSQKAVSGQDLVAEFARSVEGIIPMQRMAVQVDEVGPEGHRPLYTWGSWDGEDGSAFFGRPSGHLWARRGAAQTEEEIDFSREDLLLRLSAEIVLPLPFQSSALAGFAIFGEKKSGQKFSGDDLDLFSTLAAELALSLEMLRLQEEVIYERASKEKLDELNRLKTEFISTVSHELRTPMSSIQGLSELLQEGKVKNRTKREELLGLLASESGRLSRLIHNILDFAKIEQQTKEYHFETTEVRPLIEDAVKVMAHRIEKERFRLRLRFPPDALFLDVDRDAFTQVLINLIDNALKYSPEDKEIEIEVLDRPGEVGIEVSDRGIGISPEQKDRIFEKFYRAPEAARVNPKGVGMGLKIVKHIMDAHHGEIRVEARLPRGSTFRIIFPKDKVP
jgi:signal transduction histidine kinase